MLLALFLSCTSGKTEEQTESTQKNNQDICSFSFQLKKQSQVD